MLLRTLFTVALACALLEPAVHAVHAGAQSALRARAGVVASDQTEVAVERARRALAFWISGGNDFAGAVPPDVDMATRCVLHEAGACALEATASVDWSTPQPPRPSPCPDGTCTAYDQGNDDVREGRLEASVVVQTREPGGAILAQRTTRLRFRTWRVAPYAALDGRGDETFSPDFDDSGDDGGASGSSGTLATTMLRNALTGVTTPANVWNDRVAPAATAPARWSP
jgi:hypothetical protein